MSLTVYSRKEWGARPSRGSTPNKALTHASVHHSASGRARNKAQAVAFCRQFQAYHQDTKGWDDIGYTALIDDYGRLYAGRPASVVPAAVGGHNTGSIGLCFIGNYDHDRLTWRQRRTLKTLFEKGCPQLSIPPLKRLIVKGHQEYTGHNGNACPGRHLMRHLRWRRNRYR